MLQWIKGKQNIWEINPRIYKNGFLYWTVLGYLITFWISPLLSFHSTSHKLLFFDVLMENWFAAHQTIHVLDAVTMIRFEDLARTEKYPNMMEVIFVFRLNCFPIFWRCFRRIPFLNLNSANQLVNIHSALKGKYIFAPFQ